ncbi:hypothetical protein BPY_23080 [Bifidobacterium psychraerophilum]|uniref:hypothetical protein n=1 Tax=Bifidobacterium psychraerophilum TaxID=218140 RepID=UPI00310CCDDC
MSEKKQYRVRVTVSSGAETVDLLGFTFTQGKPLSQTTVDATYADFNNLIDGGMDSRSLLAIGEILNLWGGQLAEAMKPAMRRFHYNELPDQGKRWVRGEGRK